MGKGHSRGPWFACRWFDEAGIPVEVAAESTGKTIEKLLQEPITSIRAGSKGGKGVAVAHDLFEFEPDDAALMTVAPDMFTLCKILDTTFPEKERDKVSLNSFGDRAGDIWLAVTKAREIIAKKEKGV